jgi:hypothetical protein
MHTLHSITREELTGHECKQIMSDLISPSVLNLRENLIFIVVFHFVILILDMIIQLFFI